MPITIFTTSHECKICGQVYEGRDSLQMANLCKSFGKPAFEFEVGSIFKGCLLFETEEKDWKVIQRKIGYHEAYHGHYRAHICYYLVKNDEVEKWLPEFYIVEFFTQLS